MSAGATLCVWRTLRGIEDVGTIGADEKVVWRDWPRARKNRRREVAVCEVIFGLRSAVPNDMTANKKPYRAKRYGFSHRPGDYLHPSYSS